MILKRYIILILMDLTKIKKNKIYKNKRQVNKTCLLLYFNKFYKKYKKDEVFGSPHLFALFLLIFF